MREINDLVVRGEISEVTKLVQRIEEDIRNGWWKREPTVEQVLQNSGRGRLGAYCYSWRGAEGRPSASLLIYRTGPGELAVSSIVPAIRKPLSQEEYNRILAAFEEMVLRPLAEGLDIQMTIIPPRKDRLEQALSPEAFRRLNRFVSMIADRADLTIDDRVRWDEFWSQVYSDGSLIDDKDLGDWLMEVGRSERQVSELIARKDVGQFLEHHGSGL